MDPDQVPDDSRNPETATALLEQLEQGHREMTRIVDAHLLSLNDKERAVLRARFESERDDPITRRCLARLDALYDE